MAARGNRKGRGASAVADPPADPSVEAPGAPDQDAPNAPGEAPDTTPPADAPDDGDQDGDEGSEGGSLAVREPFKEIKIGRAVAGPTYLRLPDKIGRDAYAYIWHAVEAMRDRSKWWQGDLVVQGEKIWGDTYTQVMEATGSAYGSVANVASTCRAYPVEERHTGLSFSHHVAAQSLPKEARAPLLVEAYENDWNVDQVRSAVREWKEAHANGAAPGGDPSELDGPAQSVGAHPRPSGQSGAHLGAQPVDASKFPDGKIPDDYGYECPQCPNLVFDENPGHCLDCGAHFYVEVDGKAVTACPYCPDVQPAPSGAAREPDQVITPADRTDATVDTLWAVVGVRDRYQPADAATMFGAIPGSLPALMGLHEWLGHVIEAMAAGMPAPTNGAAPATGKPLSPVSKADQTGGKSKRSRKPPAVAAPPSDGDEAPPADDVF